MSIEVRFLLRIIKYILNNEIGEVPLPEASMSWRQLLEVARRHGLMYVLYYGVECLPKEYKPDKELYSYIQENGMYDLVVSCNQIEATNELLEKFEEEEIYVVAVKGICTKQHYPQPEIRSMGDIDLLYRESQHGRMKEVMSQLCYKKGAEGRKHDHFYCEPYIQVEMHRELVAANSVYSSYYENIWARLQSRGDCQYIYELSDEDEYIYTIIHLIEHFKNGGIGIRFIMDIYAYNSMKDMNWKYIEEELRKLDIWEFFNNISRLAQEWFGIEEECVRKEGNLLDKISTYIVMNGVFGTQKNAADFSAAENGRLRFLMREMFPDLRNMQSMFLWLKKWPILLPYSWVLRGIRSLIFRRGNVKYQFERYKYGDKRYGEELKSFFNTCGL